MTDKRELQYWAFISYSRKDEALARWLHRSLERFRIPRRLIRGRDEGTPLPERLVPIFRDRDELASAAELGSEIQRALNRSRNLIVLCSPSSARSPWVNEEIRYFKSLDRAEQVFCLIVDGEPGDAENDCFGPALRHGVGADGQLGDTQTEPIAADLRPQGDGRRDGFLKLIAGVLGVGFDELKQRQLLARNRRLRVLAIASLGLATVMLGLAYFAFEARDAARVAQVQAEDARLDAERRLEQARVMEEVFIQMFRTAGERGQGASVTAQDILAASIERINSEFADDPETAARVQQQIGTLYFYMDDYTSAEKLLARVLTLPQAAPESVAAAAYDLAQVRVRSGDYDLAKFALDTALAVWSKQPERYADDLLQAEMVKAQLLRAQGDVDGAIAVLEPTLPKRLALSGEEDRQSAVLMGNLGVAYLYAGRLEDARKITTRAWQAFEASGSESTPNALTLLGNLAGMEFRMGRLRQAEEYYEKVLSLAQDAQPESASTAAMTIGYSRVLLELLQFEKADELAVRALELALQYVGQRSPLTWASQVHLATLDLQRGRHEPARTALAKACPLGGEVFGDQNPRVARCRLLLLLASAWDDSTPMQLDQEIQMMRDAGRQGLPMAAESLWLRGLAQLERGNLVAARRDIQESAEIYAAIHGQSSYTLGRARALLGGIMMVSGERAAGQALQDEGLALIEAALGPQQAVAAYVLGLTEQLRQ
ncbi:MAG: tetratricopeptide repeat protein [Oceanococcus sp.]